MYKAHKWGPMGPLGRRQAVSCLGALRDSHTPVIQGGLVDTARGTVYAPPTALNTAIYIYIYAITCL